MCILGFFPLAVNGDLYIHLNLNFLRHFKLPQKYVEVRESHASILYTGPWFHFKLNIIIFILLRELRSISVSEEDKLIRIIFLNFRAITSIDLGNIFSYFHSQENALLQGCRLTCFVEIHSRKKRRSWATSKCGTCKRWINDFTHYLQWNQEHISIKLI